MQISIEKYQDKDFSNSIALLVSSFESKFLHRQSLGQKDVERILQSTWDIREGDPGYLHYVAKVDDKIVGTILIRYGQVPKNRRKIPLLDLIRRYGLFNMLLLIFKLSILEIFNFKDCYVEHIAVDQTMRGKGIGEQLISHCEKILLAMGYSRLSLAVAKHNPAKRLYDRLGFEEVKQINHRYKRFFIGIGEWVFMVKELT